MINLDVKGYCQDCPHFEAESSMVVDKPSDITGEHIVYCKHKWSCEWAISHCFGSERG